MQKEVRAEDDEHESKKDASNDGGGFHLSMLSGLIRNSKSKRGAVSITLPAAAILFAWSAAFVTEPM
jgi:hypothetical protein